MGGVALLAAAAASAPAGAPSATAGTAAPDGQRERPHAATGGVCVAGARERVGTARRTWVALATGPLAARDRLGGRVVARFGRANINDYPTLFAVRQRARDASCRVAWYQVQLPVPPNGRTGWIPATAVTLEPVTTRIVVDVSRRTLRLYDRGRLRLRVTVAVGAPGTPTPTGRFYVNQRLIPERTGGPHGPAALGVSAFSEVLTTWAQGGPIAIHGTDDPQTIGLARSNGCIRVDNRTLLKLFEATPAGTPVTIHS